MWGVFPKDFGATMPDTMAEPTQLETPAEPTAGDPPAKARRRRRRRKPAAQAATVPDAERQPAARPPREAPPAVDAAPIAQLARDVVRALDRLVAALADEQGFRVPSARGHDPEELVVTLTTRLATANQARQQAEAHELVSVLRERVGEAIKGTTAFHQGRVYCFYTDDPESPYATPPHATDVFAGYAANGKPEWVGFTNLCLARREPRVDRLFADPPEIVAVAIPADTLTGGLLPGFGRGSLAWRLHGQVVCGLVPRDLNVRSRTVERIALTLQVVEVHQQTTGNRLILNLVGLTPQAVAEAAAAGEPTGSAEAFRRLVRATRERIDNLGRRAALAARRGESFDLKMHVDALLTRLRSDVLRVFKTRDHRTRHAEERHQSGERPTALALSDALQTGDGRLYRDDHKDTIVVIGPKNRVHVFSRIGRHITSLELQPQDIARRVDLGRWKLLERHAGEVFRHMLRGQLEAGP